MFAIIGPTASGKSALAMALARRIGAEILSVDSMQVYRGMDVGTAKPSLAEQREVRHHLIDVIDPDQPFTAARFVEMADAVIADARTRSVPLIAVGGTPLYFKVLFQGMFEGPGADESVRARLRALPNEELHRRVSEADPAAGARIHVNDTKRLVRALEVLELTGRPISSLQTEWESPIARHEPKWIGLSWDKGALNRRINARVKDMLASGWVEEVRGLLARCGTLSKTASEATGYAELIAHVEGKLSLDDAAEQIKIATRQLARRQMKWFKRFPNVRWLAGEGSWEQDLTSL
jgi:tRNA dimethylallyltransferase